MNTAETLRDPLQRFNPSASVVDVKPGTRPAFYECGCCGAFHNARWDGDCRQDNARFMDLDEFDSAFGPNGWDLIGMDEVDAWREGNAL